MIPGNQTHSLLDKLFEPLCLALLLFVLLDLASNASSFVKVERCILRRSVLHSLGLLILSCKFERSTYLLNETGEFTWRLLCYCFNISLEHQKILGFDEDIV